MSAQEHEVSTLAGLLEATTNPDVRRIAITSNIGGAPTFRLLPGQALTGARQGVKLSFESGQDGIQLSTDNRVEQLDLAADADRCALYNDTGAARLGRLELRHLRTTGAVQLLARDNVRSGHVAAEDVDVVSADARGFEPRLEGYGVEVVPGAFTLWNQQDSHDVMITAELIALRAGRGGAPVRGSGVFVGGMGDTGGQLVVGRLETGAIHSDGGIEGDTPDRISGGVFIGSGAYVEIVCNQGPVTTYGADDMVLDNWGTVSTWIAAEKITSYGPRSIGFVNFGTLGMLRVNATIETFGFCARGVDVYDGSVQHGEFERIVTHADGAVGIQVGRPIGMLMVHRGIETHGVEGDSLVKGAVVRLAATALSVKAGALVRKIAIDGGLITHGRGMTPLELYGRIYDLRISDGAGPLDDGRVESN
jgi:hypothetical protein